GAGGRCFTPALGQEKGATQSRLRLIPVAELPHPRFHYTDSHDGLATNYSRCDYLQPSAIQLLVHFNRFPRRLKSQMTL
ncbi:MAG: hypothetical protein WCQ21_18455, partial [Verrucomicrobiota bacterium]